MKGRASWTAAWLLACAAPLGASVTIDFGTTETDYEPYLQDGFSVEATPYAGYSASVRVRDYYTPTMAAFPNFGWNDHSLRLTEVGGNTFHLLAFDLLGEGISSFAVEGATPKGAVVSQTFTAAGTCAVSAFAGLESVTFGTNMPSGHDWLTIDNLVVQWDQLYWDELGDGSWAASGGAGITRWVDSDGEPTGSYPDDAWTTAVVRTNRVTVAADRAVSSLAVESGEAAVIAGNTLSAAGLVTVEPAGTLAVAGALAADNGITNEGRIDLSGGDARLRGGSLINFGVLRGPGRIENRLTNGADGEVRVGAAERLLLAGATNTNSGRLEVIGGEIELANGLTNAASGLIVARDAQLRFGSGLTNRGSLGLSFGTTDVFGDVQNEGTIVVSGGSCATFYDDVASDKTFQISAGSSVVLFGAFTGTGGTSGTGTLFNEGDLRPGHSPAIVRFGGGLVFGASAGLEIELADEDNSDPAHPRYDALEVDGRLHLGGTLRLDWLPVPGDPGSKFGGLYDVITYAQDRTGGFAETGGNIGAAYVAGIDPNAPADAGRRAVQVELRKLLEADTDLDGDVDFDDYCTGRDGFGTPAGASWFEGDLDFDGDVDGFDYFAMKVHYGGSVGGAPAAAPEPGALSVLAAGALALLARRRRALPNATRRGIVGSSDVAAR
jgi:hypothetical protein